MMANSATMKLSWTAATPHVSTVLTIKYAVSEGEERLTQILPIQPLNPAHFVHDIQQHAMQLLLAFLPIILRDQLDESRKCALLLQHD
jgi:hypothetical protein